MILEEIRNKVEERTGLKLVTNHRKQSYVTARYIYMALAYKFTKETLDNIGRFVGKDHSTVIYALETLDNRLYYEKDMKIIYEDLLEELGKKYNPKTRSEQIVKVKNQDRQRKKLLRRINAMTSKELTKLEQYLTV